MEDDTPVWQTRNFEDQVPWSKKETSFLLDLVSKDEDWQTIAEKLGTKSAQQCCSWFDYLERISKHFPKRNKLKNPGQQRKRRKAAQIERLYKCQEKFCNRSYGTEGALKMHIKLKHPAVTYNEAYQQQARRAAAILNQKSLEEKYDDEEDEDCSYEEPRRPLKESYSAGGRAYSPVHADSPQSMSAGSTFDNFLCVPPPQAINTSNTVHQNVMMAHHVAQQPMVMSHMVTPPEQSQGPVHMLSHKPVLKRSLLDICQMSGLSGAKRFKASPEETGIVNTLCELGHSDEVVRFDKVGGVGVQMGLPAKGIQHHHPMQINFLV